MLERPRNGTSKSAQAVNLIDADYRVMEGRPSACEIADDRPTTSSTSMMRRCDWRAKLPRLGNDSR